MANAAQVEPETRTQAEELRAIADWLDRNPQITIGVCSPLWVHCHTPAHMNEAHIALLDGAGIGEVKSETIPSDTRPNGTHLVRRRFGAIEVIACGDADDVRPHARALAHYGQMAAEAEAERRLAAVGDPDPITTIGFVGAQEAIKEAEFREAHGAHVEAFVPSIDPDTLGAYKRVFGGE